MNERIQWIDQVKGFAIFLVVYGHNFPFVEKYIYSFHMPLFFMVSGFFFPVKFEYSQIYKRVITILIPYFVWSFILFLFWAIISKNIGESKNYNLSTFKNFIGVFYAQGGKDFMDWGIPMWFLPSLFLCFCLYFFIKKYCKSKKLVISTVILFSLLSFIFTRFMGGNNIWSINVSMVAVLFFCFGNFFYKYIEKISFRLSVIIILLFGIIHFFLL